MTIIMNNDPINGVAIIGMAGRFPGASNVDELWQILCKGLETITFFTDDELDPSIDPMLKSDPNYVKARGIIKDADRFDAAFFGISPREAEIMDPQQRIFLEVAWEALENAGYNPDCFDGLIGVYGGTGFNTYFTNHVSPRRDLIKLFGEHQTSIANAPDYLTTRVSYKLNLKGPSINVYTGCSLSLVAVCLGFDSLMSYQSDMVLAGGSFIGCPLNSGYLFERGTILSPDGNCRPFDAEANGTVFSDGVGIVVLKRLEDALEARDCIYGVIRGVALNNDGSNKMSFMAPSLDSQAEVIAMAQANSGISPEMISYIETHGTGTSLGDPIEIAALTHAFRSQTSANNFCAIGSIKSNLGHLDAAAGIAGLIKTTLALYHKKLPSSINFDKPNPQIEFKNSPFYVNTKLRDWESNKTIRRAGVSSFGVGGTNAHVILEEAPPRKKTSPDRLWQLLLLSAKTNAALDKSTLNLANFLEENPQIELGDVAYTLQTGRKAFNYRRIAVCRKNQNVVKILEQLDSKHIVSSFYDSLKRDIVFLFSGQGSQYPNMGLELYSNEPVFKNNIDECSEILKPHISFDLRDILFPGNKDPEKAEQKLRETFITQPALFTIEYALARLWMSWGIYPNALIGHSIGEFAAACLAGIFSLEDALSLVAVRGRLIQELPKGSMLAVFLSEKEVQALLNENLSISTINGPSLCVVSGEKEAIDDLEKQLSQKNLRSRRLHTSHAFHSKMMDPVLDDFLEQVKQVGKNPPQIPYLSCVTGTWITPEEAVSSNYWVRHLRNTVRFSDGLEELFKERHVILLEIGPGNMFGSLANQHPDKRENDIVLSSIRHPKAETSDLAFILKTIGQLWFKGIQVDWSKFYLDEIRQRLPLPTYPFERRRHWIDAERQISGIKVLDTSSNEPLKEKSPTDPEKKEKQIESEYVVSEDHVEQTLINIWKELLGLKNLEIHENYFELGGSSMVAVRLFAQIDKIFDRKLPLAALYEAPTIKQLADIIRNEEWRAPWKCLVDIQTNGSKPPIFLVHGAGGNVLTYRDLARYLGADQPVYGLQSKGLKFGQAFHTRVEDMATHYISEIQTVQPEGPYFLGGYCLGGSIAYEMAQQLQSQNQEVGLVILLETYNYSNIKTQSFIDNVYYYIQKVDFHLRNFFLLNSKEQLTFIREKAKVAKGRMNVWKGMIKAKAGRNFASEDNLVSHLYNLWETNDKAALKYVPKGFCGQVAQFIPIREYAHHIGPELGWDKLVPDGLEIYQLPVYPAGMLVEPFVQILAEKLKESLEKASERI